MPSLYILRGEDPTKRKKVWGRSVADVEESVANLYKEKLEAAGEKVLVEPDNMGDFLETNEAGQIINEGV